MDRYCVNMIAQQNGDHEVHNLSKGCDYLPESGNRRDLGEFGSSFLAVEMAKLFFEQVNGCYYCCRESHSS